jgi:catechol 2,3-dioxygenase-like lactoylglutathione lyase family enzyme
MERKINQIGIVVKDMDKAIEFYQNVMGIGPFNIIERPKETCMLHGECSDFRIKTAIAMGAGVQVELIQVLEGKTAHTEFIDIYGPGIHHFGYYVQDLDLELENCKKNGIEPIATGEFMGAKWAYMDTQAISGAIHEFIQLSSGRKKRKEKSAEKSENESN